MVVAAITIAVINFIAYVLFRSVNRWLAYTQLFLIFIFAFIVSSKEFSVFYLLLFIIAIIISEFVKPVSTEEQAGSFSEGKFSARGFNFVLLSLAVGLVMLVTIILIENNVGGNIIGTPNLAISSTQQIAQNFKPTFESMLGIIENFIFFVIMDVLLVFGVLVPLIGRLIQFTAPIFPILITAFIAGIFHIVAFSVSVSLILWAMIAFGMFLTSRFMLKDSLAADSTHFLKNLMVSVSRSLSIV